MKCFWIFNHDWSMWGEPADTYIATIKQSRYCKKCGKIQVRDIGYQDGLGSKGVKLAKDKQ